ncbi:uncharacterized protein LOC128681795 isoform X2 [Plodia interpunctella]|uniref:uncharacterized protein LOC128681795 isoform X2 n=1 Tax=Plodia interpunctella TaxID=58824 RepID=UPI002368AEB5|nr:uncharacterized protein LOC128681795 isoform X2 [Plodia interpunctella]
MSRCDYDVIFYRVFCLSLLVIAFIFTVILTNVFVDIDGLLSKKEKTPVLHGTEPNEESTANLLREMKPEIIFNEARNYEEDEEGYRKDDVYVNEEESFRNKRSLETNSFLFHLQNPNLKNVLTNHLNALLEQLDAEEFSSNSIDDRKPIMPNENRKSEITINKDQRAKEVKAPTIVAEVNNTGKVDKTAVEKNDTNDNKSKTEDKSHKEMLHLAMHDILLQGIIGHMDLNEVYRKINVLSKKMEFPDKIQDNPVSKKDKPKVLKQQEIQNNEEDKFFEELTKCKDLQDQIRDAVAKKEKKETKYKTRKASESEKPMIIRAIIDISGMEDTQKRDSLLNTKDVQGIIKFVYNGKPIKVKILSSEPSNSLKSTTAKLPKTDLEQTENYKEATQDTTNKNDDIDAFESTPVKFNIPQSYLNKAIANYFKKYDHLKSSSNEYLNSKRSINNKRFKRHIKIHYPINNKTKAEDDELYVEIETHFDSKGMKGEKRKKLIRNLIEKIENAIHSNVEAKANKTKKHYHAHVKKRIQNPLVENILEQRSHDSSIVFKKVGPLKRNTVERRHLNPIGKAYKLVNANKNEVPGIYDKLGESWKQTYSGPGFLQPSKALNSAEMSEVDVDYNRVLTFNGIPQRLQKPLNTENSEEALATNYYDLGNLKFFVKDLDHSGISVGFNQYTDEEPDPDTMRIFTGVDNLVKAYNHNYGKTEPIEEYNSETQYKNQYDYNNNAIIPDDHNIIRRSAVQEDYHSNEYKMVYNKHILPYKSYQEIFGIKMNNVKQVISKQKVENMTEKPITMDIFDKKLKPSEIFSLANMLEEYRKKRSITVKKYSNINTRRKLNKFLQTKTNKLFINKKRLKRHIDKIRIIATDKSGITRQVPFKRQEDHNIFVVSNEDDFSNRAVIREVLPGDEGNGERMQERPDKGEDTFDYGQNQGQAYLMEESQPVENYVTHVFDGRSRHNPLMSKYPHVFMEEITKSKENDMSPAVYGNIRNVMSDVENKYNIEQYEMPVPVFEPTTENYNHIQNNSTVKLSVPNTTKAKYKLSVKIMPKNITELKSGFKEIHTSINKSYDKDGLRFYSLVNVSEISKIENIENITRGKRKNETVITTTTVSPRLKAQQYKIKSMLKRHKDMIDLQLAHLNKEKQHLDKILVLNQSDSDEVLDIKLPGETRAIQIKKSELSKLLATVLGVNQNGPPIPAVTPNPQQLFAASVTVPQPVTVVTSPPPPPIVPVNVPNAMPVNVPSVPANVPTMSANVPTVPVNVPLTPVNIPTIPLKATDKKLINIIEKNDKPNSQVANVVYHGHIHADNKQHTNDVMNGNAKMIMPKSPVNSEVMKMETKSKFFIDNDMASGGNGAMIKPNKYVNPSSTANPMQH